ncbi:MAG: NAD(P)/FAD-dependent oxidoreductase [Smithellaceae bacterium]|nr:NAD(P)/FAD-dependent oxidoreductase [Smithellaceae bacterium]
MGRAMKVGILGAGFAGLYTAFHFMKEKRGAFEVTLFDKNNFFLYTPMMHEMSTGSVNARHIVVPVRKVLDPRRIHFRNEEVREVLLAEKAMVTRSGIFHFDYLILAPGSVSNFYSIPGLAENCSTFKTITDATELRNRLTGMLERAAMEKDEGIRRDILTVNVGGAGCTGVELVAEIAQFVSIILEHDYPEIKRNEIKINLIEACDRVLPSFPLYLSRVAAERLKQMGVEVMFEKTVAKVDESFIYLGDGRRLPKGIMIWTGGIKAREMNLKPILEKDNCGRVVVDPNLQAKGYSGIYAIGDGSQVATTGTALAATASVAVQQASYVAADIKRAAVGKERPAFLFNYRGDMASLGFMSGVCEVYGHKYRGFIAWMIWKVFKLAMLPRYKNRMQILADWVITFLFKRDTSRLI